jgi:hypothetical protein
MTPRVVSSDSGTSSWPDAARARSVALPRLAFRVGEAAEVLGVSPDFFSAHIDRELRWIRRGALKIVARVELERWLESSAARVLDDLEEAV